MYTLYCLLYLLEFNCMFISLSSTVSGVALKRTTRSNPHANWSLTKSYATYMCKYIVQIHYGVYSLIKMFMYLFPISVLSLSLLSSPLSPSLSSSLFLFLSSPFSLIFVSAPECRDTVTSYNVFRMCTLNIDEGQLIHCK